jgi:hypothetical protein
LITEKCPMITEKLFLTCSCLPLLPPAHVCLICG